MFENLSDKLHDVFRTLRGNSTLTESNISDALEEVRVALLEADVNIDVAKEFVETVKVASIGAKVTKSVTPAQQLIKIINDNLVKNINLAHSLLSFYSRFAQSSWYQLRIVS